MNKIYKNIIRTSSLDLASYLAAKKITFLGIEAIPSEKNFYEFLFSVGPIEYEKLRFEFNKGAEISAIALLSERKKLIKKLEEERKNYGIN